VTIGSRNDDRLRTDLPLVVAPLDPSTAERFTAQLIAVGGIAAAAEPKPPMSDQADETGDVAIDLAS
jgi:hypothetical protein